MTHPREIQWHVARMIPNIDRNEPRNVGLILRYPDRLRWKFEPEPRGMPVRLFDEWVEVRKRWTDTMLKHGPRSLHWVGKPGKHSHNFHIEMAGFRLMADEPDFDALYEHLVSVRTTPPEKALAKLIGTAKEVCESLREAFAGRALPEEVLWLEVAIDDAVSRETTERQSTAGQSE